MNDNEASSKTLEEPETLERVRLARKEADEAGQAQWREDSEQWYAFTAGDQWSEADRAALEAQLRAPVAFNRIGPMVDSVSGSEVNNRQQVQYIPRTIGDKGLNEVLTGAADYIRDNCDAEDEESHAFVDAVICGVGVTETRLSYEEDTEGAVLVERRDPLAMRWDPGAKKRNLMDRRWQQYDAWMSREEIAEKWPDAELIPFSGADNESQQPHDQSRAAFYERDKSGFDKQNGKLRVTHHQWFELESFYQVLDPATNQITDLSVEEHATLQKRAKAVSQAAAAQGIQIPDRYESVKKPRRRYMQAFVCGATVLEEGPIPCNRFTFHFITAKHDRNTNTWYGIVKPMIDPQKWANKFFSQILHIVNTNAKGGLVMEDDAVDNLQKFKEDWARADSVSLVNPGAIAGGKLMPKPPPAIPQSLNDMLQFSISSMRDVTGINLELLGMADRQQAGVLEAQRKQAAMTVLASLFDGLRRYRKEQGRTLAKFITEYLSDGRLVRIVGGDGTERYVPLIRDEMSVKYDVVVDEAPASVNQKEKTFAMLMQMLPNLQQMGVPFAPELLDYTPLPAAMVEKWKQVLQQRPQMDPRMVQQMQQANQQLQQQLQQAQMKLQSKDAEIAARMHEAQLKSDTDLTAALQKSRLDAQTEYAATVEKAKLDAQASVEKAVIDAIAKIEAQKVVAAATPQPQPTVLQLPEQKAPPEFAQLGGLVQELMGAFDRMLGSHQEMSARMDQMSTQKKPKSFNHERDANGFIVRSVPVFE